MGIATPPKAISMSQGFHQGVFSFSDEQHHHVAQQSRREKLRVQGFDAAGHPLVPIVEEGEETGIYGTAAAAATGAGPTNMLSEMFNFPSAVPTATDLMASQMAAGYRLVGRPTPAALMPGLSGDWYAESSSKQQALSSLNADPAAAMQLFLMNPANQNQNQQQHMRSPSPPTPDPQALHHHHHHQAFQAFGNATTSFGGGGGGGEGQGLSLSLSSSLQHFEMAKAEELRVRDGVLCFNNNNNNNNNQQQQQQPLSQLQQSHHVLMGYGGGAAGVVNVLRNSRYARAAQELLEEFCSVGRGQLKANRVSRSHGGASRPNPNSSLADGGGASSSAAASSSSSKDASLLSPADRFEHQRKKAKLISMLDEVDRRYNHYCDQMQMVVNSFDSVMGYGASTPYTALAQKAMSRHFRCLKDSVAAQLKQTCELLGEKDARGSSGLTKGETPRLRLLDQSLRQQRAFHHMGMMEQEAWRPQRGLPERSVNILRAWLFEHFLHPYPSDADKHLLARQTGLSKNQVSNWFINARVRLWKPMVEEMYQQEAKDEPEDPESSNANRQTSHSPTTQQQQQQQQQQSQGQRSDSIAPHKADPTPTATQQSNSGVDDAALIGIDPPELLGADAHIGAGNDMYHYAATLGPGARMRLGATGDVSLTLGLRHAGGKAPDSSRFSVRDFGGF
ncbi:BEL1-like homeodomain protein 4 [Typha latifolia]|uniref:BEL1-like homeodomain protein 4 n=1 Tax=Typha latifolia TaxID=4733 RepID=UPI003C2B25D8